MLSLFVVICCAVLSKVPTRDQLRNEIRLSGNCIWHWVIWAICTFTWNRKSFSAHIQIYEFIFPLSGSLARQVTGAVKLVHNFLILVPKMEKPVVQLFFFWEVKDTFQTGLNPYGLQNSTNEIQLISRSKIFQISHTISICWYSRSGVTKHISRNVARDLVQLHEAILMGANISRTGLKLIYIRAVMESKTNWQHFHELRRRNEMADLSWVMIVNRFASQALYIWIYIYSWLSMYRWEEVIFRVFRQS